MKKLLMSAPITLLLVASVFALPFVYISLRANDGVVNYIGTDTSFQFTKSHLNAYVTDKSGHAGLNILAVNSGGKRVIFNANYKDAVILQNDATILRVNAFDENAVYRVQGEAPSNVASRITYTYDKVTGLTTIEATGSVPIKITGMQTTRLR